jgi:hypothetical protein
MGEIGIRIAGYIIIIRCTDIERQRHLAKIREGELSLGNWNTPGR